MDWLEVTKSLGLPTAIIAAGSYGLYRVAGWLAVEVIVPIRNGHIQFLASIQESIKSLAVTQQNLVLTQQQMADELERVSSIIQNGPKTEKVLNNV